MTLIDLLMEEHQVFETLLDRLESDLQSGPVLEGLQGSARTLATVLASLAEIEDGLLFKAMEPHIGTAGPLVVMRYEHAEIGRALAAVVGARFLDEAVERAFYALSASREHLAREEQVLFDIARRSLPRPELEWLGQLWTARGELASSGCAA